MIRKKHLKFSLMLILGSGIVFSVLSIIFYFGDWHRAIFVFIFGCFVGALGIPEIEKEAVSYPAIFQTIVGMLGGTAAALSFDAPFRYIMISTTIGAVVGFTAHYWLDYIQIP